MEYRLVVEYEGFSREFDERIESIVGRECVGAGYGFSGRDIEFIFKQRPAAERAFKRVKRLRKFSATSYMYGNDGEKDHYLWGTPPWASNT